VQFLRDEGIRQEALRIARAMLEKSLMIRKSLRTLSHTAAQRKCAAWRIIPFLFIMRKEK